MGVVRDRNVGTKTWGAFLSLLVDGVSEFCLHSTCLTESSRGARQHTQTTKPWLCLAGHFFTETASVLKNLAGSRCFAEKHVLRRFYRVQLPEHG